LCTATQPALDEAPGFKGLTNVREIVPGPARLFAALERVTYQIPSDNETWTWDRVAEEMCSEPSALAITNTITDAQMLFEVLDDPDAYHLSTRLCGAHRRKVLDEVRDRLKKGETCRLVSTQVVEAGVDIDFPLVLRALGPLDRIVQAAGRCNREGRLSTGRVVVFRPTDGAMPPGSYQTGADISAIVLRKGANLHDPAVYQDYFRRLFAKVDLDAKGIGKLRDHFRYDEVAKQFRMIDENTVDIVVPYGNAAVDLLERLRVARTPTRALLRALQPYVVSIRRAQFETYQRQGFAQEVREGVGLYSWCGRYDERKGLVAENELLWG
jgi:CRISPR-associated endonuclease/helicase Cas3